VLPVYINRGRVRGAIMREMLNEELAEDQTCPSARHGGSGVQLEDNGRFAGGAPMRSRLLDGAGQSGGRLRLTMRGSPKQLEDWM